MFKIKDKLFDIKYAYVDAYVGMDYESMEECLIVGLNITAVGTDRYPDEEKAETAGMFFPDDELSFETHEPMIKVKPGEIHKWQDIAGKTIEWEDYPEDEEARAIFYVYEHEAVSTAKIEFKNVDGKIIAKLSALVNIFADDEFYDNLPLVVETEVDFWGIACGKRPEEECINKINPYLNMDNLKYVKNKNGVSFLVLKDTNMETNLKVLGLKAL